MDGAVHPAAAEQRAVGGVDDRVDVERGDVGDDDVEPRVADFGGECRVIVYSYTGRSASISAL